MSVRPALPLPPSGDDERDLSAEVARLEARVRELERSRDPEQAARIEQFAETMGGWFWEMDEELRFTYFSASVERVTGVPAPWHYGKTRQELGIRKSVPEQRWLEHLALLERRQPFDDFVFERQGPNGPQWMKTSGIPVFDAQGVFRGYRGTATDITSEVMARRTAQQLLSAVENFDELFALWDAEDRLVMCNARFREINAAVAGTLVPGTSFEEHLRGALAAGLYPEASGREEEWLLQRLQQHREPQVPFEMQRQDGRWLLIRECRLRDGSTATISADVTERKRDGERIARERDLLKKVVGHSPIILWSVNSEGVIELSEGRGLGAQGYVPGELVGRRIFDVYRDNPEFLANVQRAMGGESFSAQNETAGCVYERWFEPARDEHGEVTGVIGVSVDLTEQKRSERELAENHRVLQTALETIPDGVQVLDDDLRLVAWNERLWEVLELDGEAISTAPDPGKAFRYALAARGEYGEGDVDVLVASREAIARSPVPVHYERQMISGKWMECRGAPVPGGGYLAIYRDINERKHLESELQRLATRDELTGLSNRRSLIETLTLELDAHRRYGRPVSVLLVDLDHFKNVNDHHGHAAGDAVLRCVSKVMDGVLRDADTVGRLGGEEFAAVLTETDLANATIAAERLRAAVAALEIQVDDTTLGVTVSVGVATAWPEASVEELLSRADEVLYDAKHHGRNQVTTWGRTTLTN